MNAESLLAHYHEIADAPDAIARLRRFILDLAVRGKLVPQDANDEPASEFLNRIAAEKEQLSKSGQNRKSKPPSPREREPFDLPPCWEWTHLGSIADLVRGISFPASDKSDVQRSGLLPCLRSGNIQTKTVWDDLIYVPKSFSSDDQLVKVGDILISIANSYALVGKCSIVDDVPFEATFGAFLAAIRLRGVVPEYAKIFLTSEYSGQAFRAGSAQTTNIANITFSTIRSHSFPLPPLAEQHRIVAKVEALMVLCDRLEAARDSCEAVRDRLAAATLARLNAPDPETFQADVRFALEALPALSKHPHQIKALRHTILNLAVRGELNTSRPDDLSALVDLKLIANRRKEAALRKPKVVAPIEVTERWCVPPQGWEWVRWDQITDWITYGFTRPMPHEADGVPIVTGKNVNGGKIIFNTADRTPLKAFESLNDKDKPQKGDILITKDGSIGRTAIVETDERFCINQSVAVIWLRSCHLNRRFLQIVLDCPQTQLALLEKTAGVAIKHISIIDLGKMVFPLPPLAEQHRIVAKVDALMALCDRLEASLTAAAATRRRLLDALLAEALAPAEDRELQAAE